MVQSDAEGKAADGFLAAGFNAFELLLLNRGLRFWGFGVPPATSTSLMLLARVLYVGAVIVVVPSR